MFDKQVYIDRRTELKKNFKTWSSYYFSVMMNLQ